MKAVPVPVYDGSPVLIPPDEHSRRLRDGVKAGVLAGERRELEQQVRQLERKLPPTPRRNRAGGPVSRHSASLRPLTAAEERFVNPHRNTAAGARNSAADARLIQIVHNKMSELGAICTDGSAADGNANPSEQSAFRSGRFGAVIR